MIEEPETIRAKQHARANRNAGIVGVVLTAAVSLIVQLVQVTRADADKNVITMGQAQIIADLAALKVEVRSTQERITAIEQARRDEAQQRAASPNPVPSKR